VETLNRALFSKEGCPRPKVRNFSYESLRTGGEKARGEQGVAVLLCKPPCASGEGILGVKRKIFLVNA